MKKLLTIAFALILGASLSFAQAAGGSTDKPADKTAESGKKGGKSGKKGHKGGKKSKKSTSDTTTTPK
jgi:hypothetical protein